MRKILKLIQRILNILHKNLSIVIVIILNIISIILVIIKFGKSDEKTEILWIGFFLIVIALIASIIREFLTIINKEKRFVIAGTSIEGTKYDYCHLFDNECKEIWMVGQNLATALVNENIIDHIIFRINDDKKRKAYFIMTTYDVLKSLSNKSVGDFLIVLGNIKKIYEGIKESNYQKLSFGFDKSSTSLSGVFRDPDDDKRGMLTIT